MNIRFLDRLTKRRDPAEHAAPTVVQIDATSLSRVFSALMWLRDLGLLAWFLVRVGILLFGLVWLLGLTASTANGLLQNVVQPIAFGATLELNPLVVLIATIGFGSLFGMLGLVLGAPLTSAALHISRDLAAAKAAATVPDGEPPPSRPEPAF